MDFLCADPLWDPTLSWSTSDPRLTRCFAKTVSAWAPFAFLVLFGLPGICLHLMRRNRQKYNVVGGSSTTASCHRWMFAFKILLYVSVIALATTELVANYRERQDQLPISEWIYWAILCLSAIICLALTWSRGWSRAAPSGTIFVFWFLFTVFHIPSLYAAINVTEAENHSSVGNATQISLWIVAVALLLLESLNLTGNGEQGEDGASIVSRMTFHWMTPLIRAGFSRKIQSEDFPSPPSKVQVDNILKEFEKHFSKTAKPVSILTSLVKTFAPDMVITAVLRLCTDLLYFAGPQILRLLIRVLGEENHSWKGYFLAFLLALSSFVTVLTFHWYHRKAYTIGLQMKAAVSSVIYDKCLSVSARASSKFTTGEITNLMSVDSQKFLEVMLNINVLWSGPFQLILAVYFLYDLVGWEAAAAGLSMLFICIPISMLSGRTIRVLQAEQVSQKDKRIKLLSEVLQGIKAIKFSAWEDAFASRINSIRKKEIRCFKATAKVWAAMGMIFSVCPALVTLVTFTTYVYVDPVNHVLTAEKAFACIAIIAILRVPMFQFPHFVVEAIRLFVSVKRINSFLNCDDALDNYKQVKTKDDENAVEFDSASLSWKNEEAVLKNLSLNVKKGELVAVIGEVGSGKSSLLSAILGEMTVEKGQVRTFNKSFAYVPQHSWIQNMTVRDNILFGCEMDEKKYDSILKSCALVEDLDVLPAQDLTEIGENGINLSGGQKQRISLARAAYVGSDILLLDDPLSAVDAHVAERLFSNFIGPKGIMSQKTRIMCTHNLTYLSKVDKIVLLKDGQISAFGSYAELSQDSADFADYVKNASLHKDDTEDKEGDEVQAVTYGAKAENGRLTEDEDSSDARVSWKHILYYFKMMNYFAVLIIGSLLILGNCLNTLVIFVLSLWTADASVEEGPILHDHSFYISILAALAVAQGLFDYIKEFTVNYRFAVAAERVHEGSLEGVISSPMSFFDSNPTGRVLNRFSQDLQTVDMLLPRNVNGASILTAMILWGMLLIAFFMPALILVLLAVIFLAALTQVYAARTKRQLKRLEANSRSPLFAHFSESVKGTTVIRAYNAQDRFMKECNQHITNQTNHRYILDICSKWLGLRVEVLGFLVFLATCLGVVYFSDNMTTGLAALVLTNTFSMLEFIGLDVFIITEVESDSISLERLRDYARLESEEEKPARSGKVLEVSPDQKELSPQSGKITVSNYSTRYRSDLPDALREINISISNGERIGVCGRTGAGKSSLTLALLRVINASGGKIELDGHNIKDIGLKKLRTAITIIPQDPVMFSGTIRNNIDPTDTKSDDEVWRALEIALLKDWVKALEGGLEHTVEEGGKNLSAGQRQLVCLARALARKEQTRVLLLDEATSAVDHETDAKIQQAIAEGFGGCTIITVAHRLGTISGSSDRIMVMSKGQLIETGKPQDLLQDQDSAFYKMCKDAGLT